MTKVKEKTNAEEPFVSCGEVKKYLNELSMVLKQISEGIQESITTMDEKVKGDKSNDDE